jgi:DNA-binding transcriptional regulator YiaG
MESNEIKKLRIDLGITQKELAEKIGVTIHAVQKWEQGQRSPGGSSVLLMQNLKK